MRTFFQNHPIALFAFFTIAYGYCFFVIVPYALGVDAPLVEGRLIREYGLMPLPSALSYVGNNPILLTFFAYGASPSFAGLTVALVGWGFPGVARIFGRLLPWQRGVNWRQALRAYGGLVALALGFCTYLVAMHYALGGKAAPNPFVGVTATSFLSAFLIGIFLNPGGVLEEICGYRGFALPTLIERSVTPLRASLIVAAIWIVWHHAVPFSPLLVPRNEIASAAQFWTHHLPVFTLYMVVGNVAISIIMTHFYLQTGSSLPGILLHGMANTMPFGIQVSFGGTDFASASSQIKVLVMVAAMAVVALAICLSGGLKARDASMSSGERAERRHNSA